MPLDTYTPQYQCWTEGDFQSDRHVQRMPYASRRLYRALLQAAFVCSTRPYLPDDDEELYMLAEADDLEYWKLHMGPVRRMFTAFTNEDGQQLLERARLTRDWKQMLQSIEQKKKAGRARHGKAASAQQTVAATQQQSADALKLKSETKTKLKTEKKLNRKLTETEPETETDSVSGSVSVSGVIKSPEGDSLLEQVSEELLSHWEEKSGQSGSASDFLSIIDMYGNEPVEEVADAIVTVMDWCLTDSNYWPNELEGSNGFRNAYKTIHLQCVKYRETARKAATEQLAAKAARYPSSSPNQDVLPKEQGDGYQNQYSESCKGSDEEADEEEYEDPDDDYSYLESSDEDPDDSHLRISDEDPDDSYLRESDEEPCDEEPDEEALLRDRY